MIEVIYTSVWDGGIEVCSTAEYNPETREVTCIETVDPEFEVDILEREYITLPDGTEMDRFEECEDYDEGEELNLFILKE
jgi:hypothetical protein